MVWIGSLWGSLPVDAAVDFRAGVNRDTITIGDPIIFRMRLLRDAIDVTSFDWGDSFPAPFEIVEKRSVHSVTLEDGRVQETTDVVMTIFQVGAHEIPPMALRYVLANGDSGRVASRPIPILIQSVKASGETDIRDVKPPIQIEAQIPMWAWLVLAGLFVLIGVLIWWLKKRKKRPEIVPPPPPIDWMAELVKVKKMNLAEQGKFKPYYSLLSDILRRCVEAKTTVRAIEETTFEIKRDLLDEGVEEAFVLQIADFLLQADMVKFAKFSPPPEMVDEAMPVVENILGVLIQPKVGKEAPVTGSVPS
ncbi:MAG: hypothetical protein HOE48_11825 [Candidatus Latescibacteria bacterium]|jgi:hypothetical protein|nr:hypothetical protein [Candidatus Latescibacterota bacterium]